jgi:hypothetical protein
MIRGLNSIYAQALVPTTDSERRSFAKYVLCWCEYTHHHHEGEERFFFPECEKRAPGSMSENKGQHEAFMDGFVAMEGYFNQVKKSPEIYDGNKIRKMIETFGPIFVKHLGEEIWTITPDNLAKIFPVEKDLEENFKAMLAWIIKTSSKTTTFPWVVSH